MLKSTGLCLVMVWRRKTPSASLVSRSETCSENFIHYCQLAAFSMHQKTPLAASLCPVRLVVGLVAGG